MSTTSDRTGPLIYIRALPDGTGGPALRVELANRLLSFRYEDEESKADKLTLTLDNEDLVLLDDPAFQKGMMLETSWGYEGNMTPVRQCVVKSLKGGREVTVEAYGRGFLLHLDKKSRVFRNMRRSDVVRQIAKEGGWGSSVQDIDETKKVFPTIHQVKCSDAQLLKKLAGEEGYQWYVDHDGFHFKRRRVGQAPIRILRWYTDLRGEVQDFQIDDDLTSKHGRTRLKGRDPLERSDIDEKADDESDQDRGVLGSILELIAPETGKSQSVTRASHSMRAVSSEEVLPTAAQQSDAAGTEAKARFRHTQQSAIKLKLQLIGDPGVLAKSVVEVQGIGIRYSGRYYIRRVITEIQDGYTQDLELVSDGTGGHSTASVLVSGLELYDTGPKPKGKPNTEAPVEGADGSEPLEGALLQLIDLISPETGKKRTIYKDTRGTDS